MILPPSAKQTVESEDLAVRGFNVEERSQSSCGCGCGCFGLLTAIASFILICYIFNFDWAKSVVHRCIKDVTAAVHSGSSDVGQK